MKKYLLLIFLAISCLGQSISQTKKSLDPIFIVNKKIVSKDKISEYIKKGQIKGMKNSVSDEEYAELKKALGSKLGEKEFIAIIEIYTPAELKKQKKNPKIQEVKKELAETDEFYLHINDKAADFKATMIDGQSIQLADLKGKVVMLNFWATWCGPCLREFYEIPEKILSKFKGQEFVFIPVAVNEGRKIVQKKMTYLKEKGIDFNAGYDPKGHIWNMYATGAIPKNFIIDQDGIIQYISRGNNENNVRNLAIEIEKLLQKKP
ncbi:hypothetical protein GCM10011416_13290 [Polaribacter pacificus]|uniref:Thioredoxin domain-containing protein n=1 Tax=Polaribacter pacificus TaxID=1775173 RepID=A0A917HXJ6_9FLAO|nr:TlpA disulfide reductase family protein [Polaribacter pacificus]GGG96762.1 hypothetical protein GCM10011416_13290 [Polaribacter pacificus]